MIGYRRRAPGRSWFRNFFGWTLPARTIHLFLLVAHRYRRYGRERIPREGSLIFVGNHVSHYDPMVLGVLAMDRPCSFLARASLFRFRPFGLLLRFVNALPLELERERGGVGAMRSAAAELAAGRCVGLFPEGTRSRDGALGRFKGGFLLLAKRSGAQVVPVAITGTFEAWPMRRRFPRLGPRVRAMAGAAIAADELLAAGNDAALARLRKEIERMLVELRKKDAPPARRREER